ncbi:MAG: hypothetical protein GF400_00795 [Candidatus Eisenbacteria bacterium]|nr:hypothetical protein [Candidatus Eisenbacteria bacterium]
MEAKHRLSVLPALWAVALVVLSAAAACGQVARFETEEGEPYARIGTRSEGGQTYFRLADLAAAVDGIRYWNADNRKMTLSVGESRISMTNGSRFGVLDTEVRNLRAPVVFAESEFWVSQGFVAGPLAEAMNAEIEWQPRDGALRVRELRPAIESVVLRDAGEGTVVEFGLTGDPAYNARSRTRSTIEVMFPGARLPDSLAVAQATPHVSGVIVEVSPDGVRAEIAVTEQAASYDVELLNDPRRLEVLVKSGYEAATPAPRLRDAKRLLPNATDVLGLPGLGTETVMIDPGHGGSDPGSVGRSGLKEKDVTLSFARELAEALQREGFYAFMTRSSDSFVPEHRRAEIANLAVADVFVSVQCGAWYSGWASGFSVCYYEPPASSGRSGLASGGRGLPRLRADAADPVKDELRWDRLQEDHIGESRALARAISSRMRDALDLRNRGVAGRDLGVLSGCSMPAVQIEIGYLTNRDEEILLSDEGFLRDAARAVARGVAAYRAAAEERNR